MPLLPSQDLVTKMPEAITSDELLETTIRRLEIVTSVPSPTLISPWLRPLARNLFVLAVYAMAMSRLEINSSVRQILEKYIGSLPSSSDLLVLLDLILFVPSTEGWVFAPGDTGSICIRRATSADSITLGFDEINSRIFIFVDVLKTASDDVKSEIFVGIIRRWFSPHEDDYMKYSPMRFF